MGKTAGLVSLNNTRKEHARIFGDTQVAKNTNNYMSFFS